LKKVSGYKAGGCAIQTFAGRLPEATKHHPSYKKDPRFGEHRHKLAVFGQEPPDRLVVAAEEAGVARFATTLAQAEADLVEMLAGPDP
jgi:hypothetical protein